MDNRNKNFLGKGFVQNLKGPAIAIIFALLIILSLRAYARHSANGQYQETIKQVDVLYEQAETDFFKNNNQGVVIKLADAKSKLDELSIIKRQLSRDQIAIIYFQSWRIDRLYNEAKFNSLYPELKRFPEEIIKLASQDKNDALIKLEEYEIKLKEISDSLLTEDGNIKEVIQIKLKNISKIRSLIKNKI